MRTSIAASLVASLLTVLAAPVAQAAPAQVNVRIEGRAETLFEGPILTDGHNVRASSDSEAPEAGRRCNGLNNGKNPTPGPTPTAAAVDAMGLAGEGFDGRWYAEPFEDYFITRWGPDAQSLAENAYWGIVVNNVFTSVGGCQYQLDAGDEVLWVYDAFSGRPRLALYPGDYSGGALPLTATAALGQPFEVEVDAWPGSGEGSPPASPQRSTTPFAGAEVAPVITSPKGFEKVDTASLDTVVTGADGRTSIVFDEPGWHRIKATDVSGGAESAVRSNRLDVCVPEPSASDCGPLPPEDQVRAPAPPGGEEEPKEEKEEPQAGGQLPLGDAGHAEGQAGADALAAATAGAGSEVRSRRRRCRRKRAKRLGAEMANVHAPHRCARSRGKRQGPRARPPTATS